MKATAYNRTLYAILITLFLAACGGSGGGGDDGGNQIPTVSFIAIPISGDAPLLVDFDASGSSDSDGSIASYAWDFGDGANGSGQTTDHTYTINGTYTVTLTVTDNSGATATATTIISVGALAKAIDQQIFEKYGRIMDSVNYTLAYQSGQATVMGNVSSGNHAMFLIAGQTIPPGAMVSGHYVLQGGLFIETP